MNYLSLGSSNQFVLSVLKRLPFEYEINATDNVEYSFETLLINLKF